MMDPQLQLLAKSVSHGDDLQSLTRPLLTLIQKASGLDSVYLTLIDEVKGEQQVLFAENQGVLSIDEGLTVPWHDTLCKRALEEGRYVTTDVPGCWGDSEAARALQLQTYASVPVHEADQRLFGTLCGASARALTVGDEIVELFHLCSQLIAAQLEREARRKHAELRAQFAEHRLTQVELGSRVSKACLAADSLRCGLSDVGRQLALDRTWNEIGVFRIAGDSIDNVNAASEHSMALAKSVLEDDSGILHLVVRKQEPPVMWADPEEQSLALVICSDHDVEGLLIVSKEGTEEASEDSVHLLHSAANGLSLLAARLADHNRLEAANQVLEHHALHDALTGLPNRRYLIEVLDAKLSEAESLETQVYVAFIDLDKFKNLNDEHGHDVGDLFLQAFARRLQSVLRGHDLVARYGGDEFVFVGLGSPDDAFAEVHDNLLRRIREATSGTYELNGIAIDYVGPSIGIIEWLPGELRDADVTISRADAAMYEDKKQRRGDA